MLIHGHTHRPGTNDVGGSEHIKRMVLGDWDQSGWYIIFENKNAELVQFVLS